jgi:hypothetical protein
MESTNINDGIRSLQIIAYAFIAGVIIFMGVTVFLVKFTGGTGGGAIVGPQLDLLIVGGFSFMCLTMSRLLPTKLLDGATPEQRRDEQQAMGFYRRATILRLAPLEGAALMAVTFTLITDKLTLLLIALFLVGMMWMARPTQTAFAEWRG